MEHGQIPLDFILFSALYVAGGTVTVVACLYLLLRRGNAIAPDVTSPVRLRRWTAAFLASIALAHVWYVPVALSGSEEDTMMAYLIGGLLDCLTFLPLALVVLLCMLQDRRRPLWPVALLMAPLVAGMVYNIVTRSEASLAALYTYLILLGIGIVLYMVRAVRQYGRWLRDNFADLEHKELWQSFVVLAFILLTFTIYLYGYSWPGYDYILRVLDIVLVCLLTWRVETLSDLSLAQSPVASVGEGATAADVTGDEAHPCLSDDGPLSPDDALQSPDALSDAAYERIGLMLQQHCIATQLYLQHDLTAVQLARATGTNRFYLSKYFARCNTTYNAYINDLRIRHFVALYHEAVAARQPITAQQLANQSGYRSYSTFSLAFKQRMGQSVTAWMREQG